MKLCWGLILAAILGVAVLILSVGCAATDLSFPEIAEDLTRDKMVMSAGGVLGPKYVWDFAIEHDLRIIPGSIQVFRKTGCDTVATYPVVCGEGDGGRHYGVSIHAGEEDERLIYVAVFDRMGGGMPGVMVLHYRSDEYESLKACHEEDGIAI